jgi:hypothetical protein
MTEQTKQRGEHGHLSRADIVQMAGDIGDAKVVAIEASGATLEQLEEAVAWAGGQDQLMSKGGHPLSGIVGELHVILTADEAFSDERD